jgi:succinyl-CoA synthetase alpha subunit
VFNTVEEAVKETGANASVIFVPPPGAADAILEALDAGLELVVCITEHIPVLDMVMVVAEVDARGARLIGPNCPGATSPGKAKVGSIPGSIHREGDGGLVSRSGTLTYEVVQALTDAGIGQSTCVGIGGDPVAGTSFTDVLKLFKADPDTRAVVLMGEIGGGAAEAAATWRAANMPDIPLVAFIAGRSAPPGRRMGHAGAIISGSGGTAEAKIAALAAAGILVAETPSQIPTLLREAGYSPG